MLSAPVHYKSAAEIQAIAMAAKNKLNQTVSNEVADNEMIAPKIFFPVVDQNTNTTL